jgi:AraC-like DNA-binding protein
MSKTGFTFRHAASGSPLGRIAEAGYVRHGPGGGLRSWRLFGRYALVYLLDGSGHYADTRGVRLALVPGDLVVVRPDLGHVYGATAAAESHWHEYYLAFDGPVFDLWARSGLLLDAAPPIRHLEPIDTWLRRFVNLVDASATGGPLQETCRLQQLLSDILEGEAASRSLAGGPGDARWIARARTLLDASDAEGGDGTRRSMETIACKMGLSVEGFRKRFKRLTGQPPARYRLAGRIDRACELLSTGRMAIKEAAAATGFCDAFHFSRRFKQITGESPAHFRQRLRAGGK